MFGFFSSLVAAVIYIVSNRGNSSEPSFIGTSNPDLGSRDVLDTIAPIADNDQITVSWGCCSDNLDLLGSDTDTTENDSLSIYSINGTVLNDLTESVYEPFPAAEGYKALHLESGWFFVKSDGEAYFKHDGPDVPILTYVAADSAGNLSNSANIYINIDRGDGSSSSSTPTISINDVTTSDENAANATFTVTLSAASGEDVTIDYASSDGTATAGSDYTATSGTLTIAAGATTGTFNVPVLSDSTDENNETVTLTLSNPTNATISDSTGTLTITDDDLPTLSINDVTSSDESAANATFTVTLSAAASQDVTVDYASSNQSLSFTAADVYSSKSYETYVADIDGDGDLDIVRTGVNNRTSWLENDGTANPSSWSNNLIGTTTNGKDVFVDDMDGDGDFDVVVAHTNIIVWYENNGDGSSWNATNIDTGANSAQAVQLADLDGDGDLDVVHTSRANSEIAWHENTNGDGSNWTENSLWSAAPLDGESEIAIADIDGDGDLDIVALDNGMNRSRNVYLLQNDNGDASSFTAVTVALGNTGGSNSVAVQVADMDGDGDIDIVTACSVTDSIFWHENDGEANPSFTTSTIATTADGAYGIYVGDLDLDGDLDIVSASKDDDTIAWYENDGASNPSWTASDIATDVDIAYDVHLADIDSDGDLDIVSGSSSSSGVDWYESNAADINVQNQAIAGTDYTSSSGTVTISAGDTTATFTVPVLADSSPENNEAATLTLSNPTNATISDATGTLTITDDDSISFTASDISTSADGAKDVKIADLDGDGDLDIISASREDDKIAWYENDGAANPTFTGATIATSADGARDVHVADLDNDGDLDIVSASAFDNKIAWYENDGAADPSWTAADIDTNANGASDVHVADLDGDGDLDIISASNSDDTIAWYENDGAANPSWTAANIDTNANGAWHVHVGDMDGDGDLDIVSASRLDDRISWYENDGAANPSWTKANIATNVDSARSVHLGDMDGDGDLDIVSASRDDDTIAWYENDGAADPSWTAANIVTNANGAVDVHLSDMDGDGDLDIIAACNDGNTIAWYENDGAADPSWTAANIDTNASSARDVDVADIDGDGDLDIVAATFTNDTIAWYENNCDGNDPLIFDLNGNGVELLDCNAGVHFDVDVDKNLEVTGWVGPNDGLLVFDLDRSGQIEDMNEVFSEHFNGLGFATSLEALASLDSNHDQLIDAADQKFSHIQIWIDANSDGITDDGELSTLAEQGISSIDLNAQSTEQSIAGNNVNAIGSYQTVNEISGTFVQGTFSEQGVSPTFTLAGAVNPQATDQLFTEGLLSNEEAELFDEYSTPIAGHSISSEIIHPSADTAEFNFDFGLEATNSSMEFSLEMSHDVWKMNSNPSITNLGALIPLSNNQEVFLGLNQNHQFAELIPICFDLEQGLRSTNDLTIL